MTVYGNALVPSSSSSLPFAKRRSNIYIIIYIFFYFTLLKTLVNISKTSPLTSSDAKPYHR